MATKQLHPDDELLSHLEQIVDLRRKCQNDRLKFACIEEFVLKYGKAWKPQPKPKNIRKGIKKQCYKNALQLSYAHPEYQYCEGYATGIIPTLHAWCVDKQGNVIDNTWGDDLQKQYFGVPIKRKYIARILVAKGTYGILDNWTMGFPILTGEHKPEEIVAPW